MPPATVTLNRRRACTLIAECKNYNQVRNAPLRSDSPEDCPGFAGRNCTSRENFPPCTMNLMCPRPAAFALPSRVSVHVFDAELNHPQPMDQFEDYG